LVRTDVGAETNPKPFAPPTLKHGDKVISQTSNILLYLSRRLPELEYEGVKSPKQGVEDGEMFQVNGFVLTMMDLVAEVSATSTEVDGD
jgi:glutathione S-transferase